MVNDNWKAHWQRTRNHEGFTRGMQAWVALACVLALGWQADWRDETMPVMLGVLACAFTETDGDGRGRFKTLWLTWLAFVWVMLTVWWVSPWPWVLSVVIGLTAGALTLLGAWGERYRAMAFGAVVLSIYMALSAHHQRERAWELIPYLLGGALWYGGISLLWATWWPKPTVRHRLSQLYALLGQYLILKAELFEPVQDIDQAQRRLALALHNARLVDALNATKESLFNRLGQNVPPPWLQEAMQQYLMAQDIHERASSSHEDYAWLGQQWARSDVLYRCQRVLHVLGEQALKWATAIRDRTPIQHQGTTQRALAELEAALAHLEQQGLAGPGSALAALGANLAAMATVWSNKQSPPVQDWALFDRQAQNWRDAWARLRGQCHLHSPLMRHAVRLTLMLWLAAGVMHWTQDPHGHWILLTVLFASQPQFGATLQRVQQRAWGTVLGLAVGWALIRLFPSPWMQALFMVLGGSLFIGKRLTQLAWATGSMTVLILLSFHQMGMAQGVIPARLLDTAIGSAIAALGAWWILPNWQAKHWHRLAAQALRTQAAYLQAILEQYRHGKQDHLAYRLARRNAHNADAALSHAFSAMQQEPRRERLDGARCAHFLVLSHTLLNYLSALGAHRGSGPQGTPHLDTVWPSKLAQDLLDLAGALEQGRTDDWPHPSHWPPRTETGHLLAGPLQRAAALLPEIHTMVRQGFAHEKV